jgi:AcrR family transcriptional regulator
MSRRDREKTQEDIRAAAKVAAAEVRAAAKEAAAEVKAAAAAYARELTEERIAEATEGLRARRSAAEAESSIWVRPAPGARRARLTREEIAQAALALADAEGLDAVSMRRVAAMLGAGTMSLYHYVRTKAELIELMGDAMMAEVLLAPGELPTDWRAALRAIAIRTVATFRAHPWAIEGPPSTPGPNSLRHFDQCLEAVAGLQIDLAARIEIIALIDDYAFGFVLREAQDVVERVTQGESFLVGIADYMDAQIATGRYPHLEQVARDAPSTRAALEQVDRLMHDPDRFARGLDSLLDGIALELRRRGVAAAPDAGAPPRR